MEEKKSKYFWEGAVGARIQERTNSKTGEPFFSFELVRCYKKEGSDEMQYVANFTERNAGGLGIVIRQVLAYIDEQNTATGTVPVQEHPERSNDTPADSVPIAKIDVARVPASEVSGA